jgi:hypothetical protein
VVLDPVVEEHASGPVGRRCRSGQAECRGTAERRGSHRVLPRAKALPAPHERRGIARSVPRFTVQWRCQRELTCRPLALLGYQELSLFKAQRAVDGSVYADVQRRSQPRAASTLNRPLPRHATYRNRNEYTSASSPLLTAGKKLAPKASFQWNCVYATAI